MPATKLGEVFLCFVTNFVHASTSIACVKGLFLTSSRTSAFFSLGVSSRIETVPERLTRCTG